jgi:hypothetical protein
VFEGTVPVAPDDQLPVGEAFAGLLPLAEGEASQLDAYEPGQALTEPDLDGSTVDRTGSMEEGLDYEDLFQVGALGLMRAARKFAPAKGYKFSTYAAWWVRQDADVPESPEDSSPAEPAQRTADWDKALRLGARFEGGVDWLAEYALLALPDDGAIT